MKKRRSPKRKLTSSGGRDQFSDEKLNIVRWPMPSSRAAVTVRRTASTPRRWPSLRGNPRLLGIFVRHLDQLLAAFGIELGNRDAEELALDDRVEAEIGLADGAVDGLHRGPIPDLDGEHARLGHAYRGELSDRHGRAI